VLSTFLIRNNMYADVMARFRLYSMLRHATYSISHYVGTEGMCGHELGTVDRAEIIESCMAGRKIFA